MDSHSNTTLADGHGGFPYLTFSIVILVILVHICIGIYCAGHVHKRLIANRGDSGGHEFQNHDLPTDRTPVCSQTPDFTGPDWKYHVWPIPVAPPTSIVPPEYPRLPPKITPPKSYNPKFPGSLHTHQGPMACRMRRDLWVGQRVRIRGPGKCKAFIGRVVAIMTEDHAGSASTLLVELDTDFCKHTVLPANKLRVVDSITGLDPITGR